MTRSARLRSSDRWPVWPIRQVARLAHSGGPSSGQAAPSDRSEQAALLAQSGGPLGPVRWPWQVALLFSQVVMTVPVTGGLEVSGGNCVCLGLHTGMWSRLLPQNVSLAFKALGVSGHLLGPTLRQERPFIC
jgi:hypothetical protein